MEQYLKQLERTIKSNWDRVAVCNYSGEEFTFGNLAVNMEKFHIFFEKIGIKKGEHISLCAKNTARWAVSFLSINTYEAVVVPILCDFTPDSINNLVEHSESVVLFTDTDIWERLDISKMPRIRAVVSVNDFTLLYYNDKSIKEAFESVPDLFASNFPMGFNRENVRITNKDDQDIAVINYTSGTTSAPKGVMLRYQCFSAMVDFAIHEVVCDNTCSIVSMLPMGHIYGLVFEFIFPLCYGATIVYLGKTPSPTLLLKAMKEVHPYMTVTVPLVMEKVYKASIKPALSKFPINVLLWIPGISHLIYRKVYRKVMDAFGGKSNYFIMGGAPLNPKVEKVFKKIGIPFTVGYGMTEAAPLISWADPADFVPGSCGRQICCDEVRVDSEDPQHIAGEILARGSNICSGYFKNPEASENAFTPDGWLRTGDLGIIDKNGNIFLKGRCKTMILSANGQNIYPEEVESVINSQPYVAESIVVDRNSKLVALVYLDADAIKKASLDAETVADIPENVRNACNRVLPSYSQITKVEVMLEPFQKTPKMSIKRFLYK